MRCQTCGEKTHVVNTVHQPGGTRRQRRCTGCRVSSYTAEVWIAGMVREEKQLYTEEEAALIRKKHVDARRKNEDGRS